MALSDRVSTRSELSLGWWMLVSTAVVSVRKQGPLAMQIALARVTTVREEPAAPLFQRERRGVKKPYDPGSGLHKSG